MRHKTITLCPTTYEIARKMPNFSQWCRKIILNADTINDIQLLELELDRKTQLINDIIDGKKVWIPKQGWVKNMYDEVEEESQCECHGDVECGYCTGNEN